MGVIETAFGSPSVMSNKALGFVLAKIVNSRADAQTPGIIMRLPNKNPARVSGRDDAHFSNLAV
jgi:hypothetical protein